MSKVNIPEILIGDEKLKEFLSKGIKRTEEFLEIESASPYNPLTEITQHLLLAGGKRIRPVLVFLSAQFGKPDIDRLAKVAAAIEFIHVATLYHDDVMDEARLRRSVESANSRWGNTVAILTGDYLFAKVSALLADIGPEAVRLQASTFERLVIGQIMETQGPQNGQAPLEHYMQVVADKTGSLISASARFGAMVSGAPNEVKETLTIFGEEIGIAFQLADDIIDIASESHESGKTPGTDLREGIPTLVTLNVMNSSSSKDRSLIKLLKAPIKDEAVAVSYTHLTLPTKA